jgi:hypothetical protein
MKSGLQRVLQTGYPFWDSARPRPRNGSVSPAPETRWDQRPTLGNKDGEKTERGRESGDYGGRRWRRPDENSKRQRHSEVCVVRLPLPHRIFSIEQQPWRNPLTDLCLSNLSGPLPFVLLVVLALMLHVCGESVAERIERLMNPVAFFPSSSQVAYHEDHQQPRGAEECCCLEEETGSQRPLQQRTELQLMSLQGGS